MTSRPIMWNRRAAFGPCRLLAVGVVIVAAGAAVAADLSVDAHIDHVTVYRQGALVTRVAQVTIPAGSHRLILRGLPADVDEKTLEVTVGDASVQLGTIEVVRINEANFVSEPERELRRRIEEAGDQEAVLKGTRVATAQNQPPPQNARLARGQSRRQSQQGSCRFLQSRIGTRAMGTGDSGARKRVREANLQLRTLDRQTESNSRRDLAARWRRRASRVPRCAQRFSPAHPLRRVWRSPTRSVPRAGTGFIRRGSTPPRNIWRSAARARSPRVPARTGRMSN